MNGARGLVLLLAMALAVGCTPSASATPSPLVPASTLPPTATPSAAEPSASIETTPSAEPSVALTPPPSAPPIGLRTDWIAETLVDRVRMRSLPSTTDPASERYEPVLRTGARVYVVAGPVAGSGYSWYQVISLNEGAPIRSGWVAVASREGLPWLGDVDLGCPDSTTLLGNFAALANPGEANALACFGSEELHLLAQVTSCLCSVTGPPVTPTWLGSVDRTTYRLTAPSWLEAARRDITPAFHPDHFDLTGLSEPDLPAGVYQVTGHYDDPAAATCEGSPADGGLDPIAQIGACRMSLVITAIEPYDGG